MSLYTGSSSLKPHHSTRASSLSQLTDLRRYTPSEYLDLTFSVMVEYNGKFQPMIITMNEEREPLFQDIRHLLAKKDEEYDPEKKDMPKMKVVWGHGRPKNSPEEIELENSNIIAMLRLVRSRNGVDYIAASIIRPIGRILSQPLGARRAPSYPHTQFTHT